MTGGAVVMLDQALDGHPVDDLGPATAVALGLLTAALGLNAWLIHQGYAPLTALARSPVGRAFRSYFDRHCDQAPTVDLFSIGGHLVSRIPQRRFP